MEAPVDPSGLTPPVGADGVVDYTKEDFTTSNKTYDVISDVAGKLPFSRCKSSLKSGILNKDMPQDK